MKEKQKFTLDQWKKLGEEKYGKNQYNWKFKCPACGYIATPQDYIEAGAPDAIAFSCIGRFKGIAQSGIFPKDGKIKKGIPCDYAGGGLFKLNPINVDGHCIFEFAD